MYSRSFLLVPNCGYGLVVAVLSGQMHPLHVVPWITPVMSASSCFSFCLTLFMPFGLYSLSLYASKASFNLTVFFVELRLRFAARSSFSIFHVDPSSGKPLSPPFPTVLPALVTFISQWLHTHRDPRQEPDHRQRYSAIFLGSLLLTWAKHSLHI